MPKLKSLISLIAVVALALPLVTRADIEAVPGSANWYFHADLAQLRSGGPGSSLYQWLRGEVFDEVKNDSGIDIDKEVDRLTSYSSGEDSAVLIVEGGFSQRTRDLVMTFIASGGDIDPLKSAGKTYYHFSGDDDIDDDISYDAGSIDIQLEALGDESWISMAVKNKLIVTATEGHMKRLLANNGKVIGDRGGKGALLVLTAEKSLLQGGMKAGALGDDDWDSNILRNTEQVAFLISAAADKLAIEAKLITTEAEMAESLASVVRGLISLASFDDEMNAATIEALRGTKVKAKGNSLSISLAVDPTLVVDTLRD